MGREEEVKNIIDDLEAGLIDDPIEDYKYLNEEAGKYQNHELAEDIYKELGRMMYVDIPKAARKALKDDMTGDVNTFNALIDEAYDLIRHGGWGAARAILSNLIGNGIGFADSETVEFRSFDEEIQDVFYNKFFHDKSKKIINPPVNLSRLYGLLGCTMMEFKDYANARVILSHAVHFNPMNMDFCFEYAETFKLQGDLATYEKLSREYLSYAYKAKDVGRLYRNLGFVYIEKKVYDAAIALYAYSKAYDPDNKMVQNELDYIAQQTGKTVTEPSKEEADAVLTREGIQIGSAVKVQEIIYRYAYTEASVNHNVEKTQYFCNYFYDLTRNENTVKELMDMAKDPTKGFGGILSNMAASAKTEPRLSPYDREKADFLKTVFSDYPDISTCRLKITFTMVSAKYEETINQILAHIDDMSKVVDKKDIAVYYPNFDDVKDNIEIVNDIIAIAGGWKSFCLTINDVKLDKYQFRYFLDDLGRLLKKRIRWNATADEVQKKYKKAAAPKRAKKQNIEDGYAVNMKGCTPQEIVTGIANTYATVYLSDCDVKAIRVSDEEIVLCANDDFVVDFWVSPYRYGYAVEGTADPNAKPYQFPTYFIQELSRNNIFKYNAAAFRRIFYGEALTLETLRFDGPDHYVPTVNHFHKIDKAYPEFRLMEKYLESAGDPYTFILFEMENADGTVGKAIGYTDKKPRDLLLKVCKDLETQNQVYLEGNSAKGLVYQLSKSFITAFFSWKGEKKTKRLEDHMKYYSMEKTVKDKNLLFTLAKEIMEQEESGNFASVERKTYADIGRK